MFEGGYSDRETVTLSLKVKNGGAAFDVNGTTGEISGIPVKGGPLALIAHKFSILICSKFAVQGEEIPYKEFFAGDFGVNVAGTRCTFTGPSWSYEYRFWPQGVLKSPEIKC